MIKLLLTILYLSIPLLAMLYMHERAHESIATYHGCLDGKFGIDLPLGDAYFQCLEYHERTADDAKQEYLLHGLNDIVGYHIISFYVGLVAIMFLWRSKT